MTNTSQAATEPEKHRLRVINRDNNAAVEQRTLQNEHAQKVEDSQRGKIGGKNKAVDSYLVNKDVHPAANRNDPLCELPAGFQRKSDGIYALADSQNGKAHRILGPIDFLAQTRDDASASWGLLMEWPDDDAHPHRWSMRKSLLSGTGSEIFATLADRGCYVSTTKHGRYKILELLSAVTVDARARAVEKVGWVDGAFALPDRTIGDKPKARIIFQGSESFDHAYRCKGELGQWQQSVARACQGNSLLVLALSAGFAGPLLSPLGEEGGGIHLRGPSSIGKSTALCAAGSIWGGPDFVRQWRTTANALEGSCVQHNGTLLCLDELAQLDPNDAGIAAYMISNGSGKARADRSGLPRAVAKWQVIFLSTGEIGLAELVESRTRGPKRSAAGQEVRILDCEADVGQGFGLFETLHDAPDADAFARQIKQAASEVYGLAGPAFVDCLVADSGGYLGFLNKKIDDFVSTNVPANADGQVKRAGRRFAVIAAAGELAARYDILPWAMGEATSACAAVFQRWLAGRGGLGSAEDRDAIAKVRGFLELHGSARFQPIDDDDNDDEPVRPIINRVGFSKLCDGKREYYILPLAWKNEVCAGMDATRVAKVLAERKLLRPDAAGKNSCTKDLPGLGKTRCYIVTSDIFETEVGAA